MTTFNTRVELVTHLATAWRETCHFLDMLDKCGEYPGDRASARTNIRNILTVADNNGIDRAEIEPW